MNMKYKKLFRYNIYHLLILLIVITILYIMLYITTAGNGNVINNFTKKIDDITCHYVDAGDALPGAENLSFPANSIFFHETSCKTYLDSRQACSVESAARAHPHRQINVLFSAPYTDSALNSGSLSVLKKLNNVRMARVHIVKITNNTLLESIVSSGALNSSSYHIAHTSDVLRLLTLYKWGGLYLDLDVVVTKSLDPLGSNWLTREDEQSLANGIMAFSMDHAGRSIAEAALREMSSGFRGKEWGANGPALITKVMKSLCSTNNVTEMSASTCNGIEVTPPEYFYPIHWKLGSKYFESGDLQPEHRNAYGYHVWNKLTRSLSVPRDCPYAKLAEEFCPSIYKYYGENFGV